MARKKRTTKSTPAPTPDFNAQFYVDPSDQVSYAAPVVDNQAATEVYGSPGKFTDWDSIRGRLLQNMVSSRWEFVRQHLDPRRDIDSECGFPTVGQLTREYYGELYDRESIAARVVEVLPQETWKSLPCVFETEDVKTLTPFEAAWAELPRMVLGNSWLHDDIASPIWEYLNRVDILSGIGAFGVLLIGIDDGQPLNQPARLFEPGEGPKDKPEHKLTFLRPFEQRLVDVTRYDNDVHSPRFGQPTMYMLTFNDPRRQSDTQGAAGVPLSTQEVHWTRILHVADTAHQAASSEVFAVPRMRAVINNLLGLRKLYAGSPEMYWRGAFPGLSFETHPTLGGDVDITDPSAKDSIEKLMNGLERYVITAGMSVKSLAPQVVDPTPQIMVQIQAICIKLGIPQRIFLGSERGELASSQDDRQWNDVIRHRQNCYVTPRIIVPFINRLIALGVLPEPGYGKESGVRAAPDGSTLPVPAGGVTANLAPGEKPRGYMVKWPDLDSLSDLDRSQVAMKRTEALMKYVVSSSESVFPLHEFFVHVMGMDPEVAQAVVDAAGKQKELLSQKFAPIAEPGDDLLSKGGDVGDNDNGGRRNGRSRQRRAV